MNATKKIIYQGGYLVFTLLCLQSLHASAASVGTGSDVNLDNSQIVNLNHPPMHGGFGGQGGHGGPRGDGRHHQAPSADQKAAMEACLQSQGITAPQPPSAEQRAAMEACRASNPRGDREALNLCVIGKGFALPEMPSGFRQAMDNCRSQLGAQ